MKQSPFDKTDLVSQKREIRREIRLRRQQLSAEQRQSAAHNLVQTCESLEEFKKAERLACFLSNDGEIPTEPLLRQILQNGKQCDLPKLKAFSPNQLWMLPYDDSTPLAANRFGIPEPDLMPNFASPISKLDIIFMPLVAFDNHGQRLGMGGGFYDRTLAHLADTQHKPTLIGLAFECQRVDKLPVEPWDFPLDLICTERACYHF